MVELKGSIEVTFAFREGGEPLIVRDKDLISRVPLFTRLIELQSSHWRTEDTVIKDAIPLPFQRESAEFVLEHLREYEKPDGNARPRDYPEACAKTLDELKDIMELSNFLECQDFMSCIGAVIADKLEGKSAEFIIAYFGHPESSEEASDPLDPIAWIHPPPQLLVENPDPDTWSG